jgi:hypothetical protein
MNQDELTALFKKVGARKPEGWARSQIEEGIPQLARFLFLRQAWHRLCAKATASGSTLRFRTPTNVQMALSRVRVWH